MPRSGRTVPDSFPRQHPCKLRFCDFGDEHTGYASVLVPRVAHESDWSSDVLQLHCT
jgi:hypothetical protein